MILGISFRREHHRLCLRLRASANAWFVMTGKRRAAPHCRLNLQAAAGFLRAARAAEFASASHRS